MTPETSKFHEHHLQWLVQYVLRLYASHENQQEAEGNLMAGPSRKIGVVESRDFDMTTSKYVDQLLRSKNYRIALAVSMYAQNLTLKSRLLYETLGVVATFM